MALKYDGLKMMLGIGPDWSTYPEVARYLPYSDATGGMRVQDFFVLVRVLGVSLVGVLLFAFVRSRLDMDRAVRCDIGAMLGIGVGGIALMLLIMLPPAMCII